MKEENHESYKGKLVKKWAKFLHKESWKLTPGKKNHGSGIYILHKNKKIYYIGLATISIRKRLYDHLRDHHKDKWDQFSFYQIPKSQYVKDIESILLGTYKAKGNKQGGKFKKSKRVVVSIEKNLNVLKAKN